MASPSTRMSARVEHDWLGPLGVPADALYGAQTARAMENFRVSGRTLAAEPQLLRALGEVKAAAALANAGCGELEADVAEAIVQAAREVAAGQWAQHFPLDVVQGGGGTATNMNINEVVANRAGELLGDTRGSYRRVHPNDHVNRSQSTNDVYPTALQLAVRRSVLEALPGLEAVAGALDSLGERHPDLVRMGRTCLQDALPVPVGAVHRAQARAVRRGAARLAADADELLAVPLGATAVGTGLGAPAGYRDAVVALLAEESGLPVVAAPDPFDALEHFDVYLRVASSLLAAMLTVAKLAGDLRFLSAGPVGEVELPAVQVGSSVMPGKVNPVIAELVLQVGFGVRGCHAVVEAAVAAGELELNVMEPVIARHLLDALRDTGRVAQLFADRCLAGLRWKADAVGEHMAGSYAADVLVAQSDGYERASELRRLRDRNA
jgi:aspartate ammonia-lyase